MKKGCFDNNCLLHFWWAGRLCLFTRHILLCCFPVRGPHLMPDWLLSWFIVIRCLTVRSEVNLSLLIFPEKTGTICMALSWLTFVYLQVSHWDPRWYSSTICLWHLSLFFLSSTSLSSLQQKWPEWDSFGIPSNYHFLKNRITSLSP